MNHFQHKWNREYDSIESLVNAAILYGIISQDKKEIYVSCIHDAFKGERFYEPTHLKFEDENGNEDLRVPLTLKALKGILKQFEKEAAYIRPKVVIELEKPETEQQTEKTGIKVLALVLKHVYLSKSGGQPITSANKENLAKGYGYGSGENFRNEFVRLENDANRVALHSDNKRSANMRIAHQKQAIELLKLEGNQSALDQAVLELGILENIYYKHYS